MARRIDEGCSFCGKKKDQVRKLVAGPGVFICDQCIELCVEVLKDEPPAPHPDEPARGTPAGRGPRGGWFTRFFHSQVARPV